MSIKKEFDRKRKTLGTDQMHYSRDLIRQYEDPEFARAAEEYERQARRERAKEEWYGHDEEEVGTERRIRVSRKKRYRFRPWKLIRNILVLVLIVLVALGAVFFSLTSKLTPVDLDENDLGISTKAEEGLKDYRNIVILGSDARADETIEGSRTDGIVILSINKKTGDAAMISVMRDSYLQIAYSDGSYYLDKITHAYHYGGAEDTLTALNRNLDLNCTEYVLFTWKAVADAVDQLGGIEVDVQENEISDMNSIGPDTALNTGGTYTPLTSAGTQTLDGVQAATYCRIRQTSGGDESRGNRTKIVMEAIIEKAGKSPLKLKSLCDTVLPEIQTNLSRMELLGLAIQVKRMNVTQNLTWPKSYWGGFVGDIWAAVPDTLYSNVVWLHQEAFGQSDYDPSETVHEISRKIYARTGVNSAGD